MTKQEVFLQDAECVSRYLYLMHERAGWFSIPQEEGRILFPVTMWIGFDGGDIAVADGEDPFERYAAAILLNRHSCDGDVRLSCDWAVASTGWPVLNQQIVFSQEHRIRETAERYVPRYQIEMLARGCRRWWTSWLRKLRQWRFGMTRSVTST